MSTKSRAVRVLSNPLRREYLAFRQRHDSGPKAVANSVMKSGTHLLVECLKLLPNMVQYHDGIFLMGPNSRFSKIRWRSLARMGGSSFVSAHFVYSDDVKKRLAQHNIKIITIVRDPRDVAISYYKYAVDRTYDAQHKLYLSMPNDDVRLKAAIAGNEAYGEPARTFGRFTKTLPWRENGSLMVRFEDLIGEKGGGDAVIQRQTIEQIGNHLGLSLTPSHLDHVQKNVYNPNSMTFRKGAINQWRDRYSAEHKALAKEVFGELLIDLGYEKDLTW